MTAQLDQYRGHICVTVEPGCTCEDHANALRERDRLTAELEHERARTETLIEAVHIAAGALMLIRSAESLRDKDDIALAALGACVEHSGLPAGSVTTEAATRTLLAERAAGDGGEG